jgi:hypothetical protein
MAFIDVLHLLVKSPCESMMDAYSSVFIGIDIRTQATSCLCDRVRVRMTKFSIGFSVFLAPGPPANYSRPKLRRGSTRECIKSVHSEVGIVHKTRDDAEVIDSRRVCGVTRFL